MNKSHFLLVLPLIVFFACSDDEESPIQVNGVATSWADMTLLTISKSFPNSPTYSSRSLGYLGLTMYESVIQGSSMHKSVAPELSLTLPLPETDKTYNWSLALNAGQSLMLRSLYPHAPNETTQAILALEHRGRLSHSKGLSQDVIDRSIAYGQSIASAIFEWSTSDGGHEGYLANFDPEYQFPEGDGYWTPPVGGQTASVYPLHPYWGNNRTFIPSNMTLDVPQFIPFSSAADSEYYQQFKAVYDKRNSLTLEEKNIAAWWADDPTQTSSPPGHSYNLTTVVVKTAKADLFTTAEAYAKTGMAVADAFINCWKCKYTYHAERPFPYIRKYIDTGYLPFWPEPPFPSFSSGHATQSAAAAMVLEDIFGENFALVDNTHAGRAADFPEISYTSRSFNSIWETAQECANSRFFGGIHTRQDNLQGQLQGKIIGANVNQLPWRK